MKQVDEAFPRDCNWIHRFRFLRPADGREGLLLLLAVVMAVGMAVGFLLCRCGGITAKFVSRLLMVQRTRISH